MTLRSQHTHKSPRKASSARFLQKVMNRDEPPPPPPPQHYPTTASTPSATPHTHADEQTEQSDDEKFRALDRALAKRYLELVIAHRRAAHLRAIAHPDAPVLRPRMELRDAPAAPHVTALFELPGLRKDQISVHLTPAGKLTVSGERRAPAGFYPPAPSLPSSSAAPNTTYPVRELRYGRYERSVDVPRGLEVKDISASLTDGMLAISWPRVAPAPTPGPAPHHTRQEYLAPASPPWSHRPAHDQPHLAQTQTQQQAQGPAWGALPPFRYSWPGPPGQ